MPLSASGYTPKTFEQIVDELEEAFRSAFGDGINLEPQSAYGQEIAIFAKFVAENYEDQKAVIDAVNVFSAYGVAIDMLLSIVGLTRQSATYGTGTVTCYGTLATVIPEGTAFSVEGNSTARFLTTADATIGAGVNEVQAIEFDAEPDAGNWTLIYDGVETGTLTYASVAADVEAALEALSNLESVTVTGDFASGFSVEFTGADGEQAKELLKIGTNTLEASSVAVAVTITETTAGSLPSVDVAVEAESAGRILAYAGTLNVIEDSVSGLDSVTNAADINPGQEIETDAEAVERRQRSLSTGKATLNAIYRAVLEINEVTDAKIYENDTDTTDGAGRPPHSIQAVVLGGDDQDIIDAIGESKGAGAATYGAESGYYVSEQGTSHLIYFDRPTEVPIYITVNITTDADFPADGQTALQQWIAEYGSETFTVGDVVAYYKLYAQIDDSEIAGIVSGTMTIGLTASPVGTSNITIDETEIATFDTANIVVNIV